MHGAIPKGHAYYPKLVSQHGHAHMVITLKFDPLSDTLSKKSVMDLDELRQRAA